MAYRYNAFTGEMDESFISRNELFGMSSGIIDGGLVTINVDTTKFDLSSGRGVLIDDWTNPDAPVMYNVSWPSSTANTVTYLTATTFSIIGIDVNGDIVQFDDTPTDEDRRKNIILVTLAHTGKTVINTVTPRYNSIASPINQLRDMMVQVRGINRGISVTPNGANLKLNRSAGSLLAIGIGFLTSAYYPNKVSLNTATAVTFQYRTQTGASTANITDLLPDVYDVGGVATTIGGGVNRASNQRVYIFPNGNIRIQYGQQYYSSLDEAVVGLSRETFIEYENIRDGGFLIGAISVIRSATTLDVATHAIFNKASKFGELFGGGGSASGVTDHTLLSNIGTNTHAQIDNAIAPLVNLTIAKNTSTPNATVPVISITPTSSETNIDFTLNPKGTGALTAQVADNTTTGGNKRGANATDLQTSRLNATHVASGSLSIAIGGRNVASNSGSNAIGFANTVSGSAGTAIGDTLTCTAQRAFVSGYAGDSSGVIGKRVHASNLFGGIGDSQMGDLGLRTSTTDATATTVTVTGGASTNNQLILPNNSVYGVIGTIVGKKTGSTDAVFWKFEVMVVRGANAAATTVSGGVVTAISNAPAWGTPTLAADTTNGGLRIQVVGLAATTARWHARVETNELTYA
jgi:hypothetical protein